MNNTPDIPNAGGLDIKLKHIGYLKLTKYFILNG